MTEETAKFEDIGNITQIQYFKLLNLLAKAIGTKRGFIEILGKKELSNGQTVYRVKSKGGYYHHITFIDNVLIYTAREIQ